MVSPSFGAPRSGSTENTTEDVHSAVSYCFARSVHNRKKCSGVHKKEVRVVGGGIDLVAWSGFHSLLPCTPSVSLSICGFARVQSIP